VASFFLLPEGLVPDGDGSSSDSRQILMPPARSWIRNHHHNRCFRQVLVSCRRLRPARPSDHRQLPAIFGQTDRRDGRLITDRSRVAREGPRVQIHESTEGDH